MHPIIRTNNLNVWNVSFHLHHSPTPLVQTTPNGHPPCGIMWPNDRIQKRLEELDKGPRGIDLASKLPRSQYNQPFMGCDRTINRTLVASSASEGPEVHQRTLPQRALLRFSQGQSSNYEITFSSLFVSLMDLTASFIINVIFSDLNSQCKFNSFGADDLCAL